MNRITWEEGRFSSRGRVGGLSLFTTGYGTASTQPRRMYYLRTSLPVGPGLVGQRYATEKDAQEAAERLLGEFVHQIGAVFPDRTGSEA